MGLHSTTHEYFEEGQVYIIPDVEVESGNFVDVTKIDHNSMRLYDSSNPEDVKTWKDAVFSPAFGYENVAGVKLHVWFHLKNGDAGHPIPSWGWRPSE